MFMADRGEWRDGGVVLVNEQFAAAATVVCAC